MRTLRRLFVALLVALPWCIPSALRAQPSPSTSTSATVELGQSVPLNIRIPSLPADTTYQWYKDGTLIAGATTNVYTIAAATAADAGTYLLAISYSGTTAATALILTVKPAAAPFISTPPRATTAFVGQSPIFSFVATGSFPRTHQWSKDGAPIAGATLATLTLPPVNLTDAGAYSVVVSNSVGAATSAAASLTVNPATPLAFTTQPLSQTLFQGQRLNLFTSLSGSSPLTYQWRKDGAPIAGATLSGYSIPATALSDSGAYSVVVTNPAGSLNSAVANITVNPAVAPTITTPPRAQTVPFYETIDLRVVAGGSPPFTYLWKRNGVVVPDTLDYEGRVVPPSENYFYANATAAQSGSYTVTITNAAGSITSSPIDVTVTPIVAPTITRQPADQAVNVGTIQVTLSVGHSSVGAGPLFFQWFKNGVPLADANTSSYIVNYNAGSSGPFTANDVGTYTVVISGGGGTVTSAPAKLYIAPPLLPRVSNWNSVVRGPETSGSTTTLSVSTDFNFTGSAPFTFQWAKDGAPIPGATDQYLSFPRGRSSDVGTYTVTIANDSGLVTSPGVRVNLPILSFPLVDPNPTPWLDAGRVGDVVYFLATSPSRIERYDLAAERWLTTTLLRSASPPTAFAPAAEGIYVAYGRALVRHTLDLTTETPLTTVPADITLLFVFENYLYYSRGASGFSGYYDTSTLHRSSLQPGPESLIDASGRYGRMSFSAAVRKGFRRTLGASPPGRIEALFIATTGAIDARRESPPQASGAAAFRTYVFPGDQTVADDSGALYRAADLVYVGSLGEPFTDLSFLSDGTPVVLRGTQLTTHRTDTFLETARTVLPQSALRVYCRGNSIYAFGIASAASTGSPFAVTKSAATALTPVRPPAALGLPTGRYSVDDAFLGEDRVVHIFSRTLQAFVRWDATRQHFLPSLPLRSAPTAVFHQPGNSRVVVTYPDKLVTEVPLRANATERPLFNFSPTIGGLVDLGDMVAISFGGVGTVDTRDDRVVVTASGPQFTPTYLYDPIPLAWHAGFRRLYSKPEYEASLNYEVITPAGTIITTGNFNFGGASTRLPATPPLRFNADQTVFATMNGRVYAPDFAPVATLSVTDLVDATWLGAALYTLRPRDGATELQYWAPGTYIPGRTLTLPGAPIRVLRVSDSQLVVVTTVQGYLSLTLVNADLTLVAPAGAPDLPGTYFGQLRAAGNATSVGDFAFHLRPDGTGALLIHLATPRADLLATNPTLGSDGAFFVTARDLATGHTLFVQGYLTATGLTGTIASLNLSFTATKAAAGPSSTSTGFYVATALNGTVGSAYAIVGPDSRALLIAQATTNTGAAVVTTTEGNTTSTATFPASTKITTDGGITTLTSNGQLTLTTTAGTHLSATFDPATRSLTATAASGLFPAMLTTYSGVREDILHTDRLANISTRGRAGPGDDVMIAGFVLSGTAPRPVLIRAIGPTLGAFGVPGTLADPRLELYRGATKISENDNWSTSSAATELAATTARVGGFALAPASADAALFVTLDPGAYTAQVTAAPGSASGNALVEVYDTGTAVAATEPRLINIATRGRIAAVGDTFIAGIVVTGNVPKRLLIRAIGPGLAAFGVPGTLPDPILSLAASHATGSIAVATNDDWSTVTFGTIPAPAQATPAEIAVAASSVGAFPLPPGSKDACLLLTLSPGNYTAQVVGKNNGTGGALVEVYEVNP